MRTVSSKVKKFFNHLSSTNYHDLIAVLSIIFLVTLLYTNSVFANEEKSEEPAVIIVDDEADSLPSEQEAKTSDIKLKKGKDKQAIDKKVSTAKVATMAMAAASSNSDEIDTWNTSKTNPVFIENVTNTGASAYSVPLDIPTARAGLKPDLRLRYNSLHNNGWLGMGWSLDLGSIQRSSKFGLDYSSNDFVIVANDTQRPLTAREEWGSNYYGEKIESAFTKYYFNPSTSGWEATDKNGVRYFFGTTVASRIVNPEDNSNILKWCLDYVQDANGNNYSLNYVKDQGAIYLHSINYSGNSITGNPGSHQLNFHLEERTDIEVSLASHFPISQSKRLNNIEILSEGQLVRKYQFTYDYGASGKHSRLKSMQEIGSDGTSALPATTFDWLEGGTGTISYVGSRNALTPQLPFQWWDSSYSYSTQAFGDINGDGRADMVTYAQSVGRYHWDGGYGVKVRGLCAYYLSSSNGTFQPGITLYQTYTMTYTSQNSYPSAPALHGGVKLIDINGDGLADLVQDGKVRFSTGEGFGPYVSLSITPTVLGDVDGDGLQDSARYYGSSTIKIEKSNGNGIFTNIADLPRGSGGDLYLIDINGDGFADLVRHNKTEKKVYISFFKDSTFLDETFFDINVTYKSISFADINGDGLVDLAVNQYDYNEPTTSVYTYLSDGSGSFGDYILTTVSATGSGVVFSDINGDGNSDLLVLTTNSVKSNISLGNGLFDEPVTTASGLAGNIYLADLNGDGNNDFISRTTSPAGIFYGTTIQFKNFITQATTPQPDLMESVSQGTGAEIQFTYKSSKPYTLSNFPSIFQVVDSVAVNDGLGNISTAEYDYAGGLYDYITREFRGFETMTLTNPDGTIYQTQYHQDEFLKGKLKQEGLWAVGAAPAVDTPLSLTTNIWETEYLDTTLTTTFVKLSQSRTEQNDEVTVFTQQDYIYDNANGNPLSLVTSGTGAENVTTNFEWNNYSDWLWRNTRTTITGSVTGKVRESILEYETDTGNLTTEEKWLANGINPRVIYQYDSYGNVIHKTDAKNNVTVIDYDAATNIFPIKITYPTTNGISHIVEMAWDTGLGKKLWDKDENGQITSYTYDPFGRTVQTDSPNGGQTMVTYFDNVMPRYTLTEIKEDSAGNTIDSYRYFDGLNRKVQTVTFSEAGKTIISKRFYDEMGRMHFVEGPFFATDHAYPQTTPPDSPWSLTVFDDRGRPISIDSPDGQHGTINTFISYSGLATTTTDPDNASKTELKDYLGRVVQVTEHADQGDNYITTYNYNAAGDLLDVTDHHGNLTTISYDTLGRKTGMSDPDMGVWSYAYDPNSNLISQTDAKNQTITFGYDNLNRLVSKTYSTSDPNVTFSYDNLSISNGRGRLYQTTNGQVTDTIDGYDALGNVLSNTRTLSGAPQSYTTQTSYDLSGKPVTLTYPDNFNVTNNYIPGTGLVYSVVGSDGVTYAQMSNYTPQGKIGRIDHGNYTYTQHTYDSASERLISIISTRTGPTENIQERSYLYTAAGDIAEIADTRNGITYNYTYDKLHRLTGETNTGSLPTLSYSYDAIGNITSKTFGSGTLTYSYSSTRPHAVNNINSNGSDFNYIYDPNGNMTSGPDLTDTTGNGSRNIVYNSDNMPVNVTNTKDGISTTMDLIYDGNGSRAIKSVMGSATTYYIGEHFQVSDTNTSTENTKYIFAGNLRIAQIKNSETHYFHKDHLGSSTVMTDVYGATLEASEYMPYGSLRDHVGDEVTNYKFTDQELDPESGLYNYDARLYDSVIGRFISADTFIPDPFNPQSFNRYSYVYNNPLRYIDPTGHWGSMGSSYGGDLCGEVDPDDPGAHNDTTPGVGGDGNLRDGYGNVIGTTTDTYSLTNRLNMLNDFGDKVHDDSLEHKFSVDDFGLDTNFDDYVEGIKWDGEEGKLDDRGPIACGGCHGDWEQNFGIPNKVGRTASKYGICVAAPAAMAVMGLTVGTIATVETGLFALDNLNDLVDIAKD